MKLETYKPHAFVSLAPLEVVLGIDLWSGQLFRCVATASPVVQHQFGAHFRSHMRCGKIHHNQQ